MNRLPYHPHGSALAITLFLMLALIGAGWIWVDLGKASLAGQRSQAASDMSVLSSLRVSGEALGTVAGRWEEFGALFGLAAADRTVELRSGFWPVVEKKAGDLKRAVPGYQGRATAVIKVVAEANGFSRESLDVIDSAGSRLQLTAERAVLRDENGRAKTLEGAWYSRRWSLDPVRGERSDSSLHAARMRVPTREGDVWTLSRAGRGRMAWDVDAADPAVRASGNGGYPRTWSEAVENGRLNPHRWPVFRARLTNE